MSDVSVRRVAVLGAGTTGGALAAHLTNLGFSVSLLDVTPQAAATGLEHVRSAFYVHERAGEIRVQGLDEGIPTLDDADWIVEAIPERLDVKRALYERIAPHVRPDAVVTTCSPSLPVSELVAGFPEAFARRFLAAYFALPLAEHRLVEIRSGPDQALARDFRCFLSDAVARKPVHLADGPGLVARYGAWCLLHAVHVVEKLRLDIEDVEAITGLGQSGGGIFGAVDRLGLDEIRDIAGNLRERLPNDRGVRSLALPDTFVNLLARGWTGDKSGRGYYRREGRERLALNLTTMAYRQVQEPDLPGLAAILGLPPGEGLRTAMAGRGEVGEYLREFLLTALRYAEYLRDAMKVSVLDFDRTMEWGFGWEKGPFALLDDLQAGAARYYDGGGYLTDSGYEPLPEGEVCPRIEDCAVIDQGVGYTIHDLDDGIQAVALHAGVLGPERVDALDRLLWSASTKRFVLTSEGRDFPGLDLEFVLQSLRTDPPALDAYLAALQALGERLQSAACVAAIVGRCVGPSLGLALSCAGIVAAAEAEIGFDEARLGLVPTARATAILRALHGDTSRKMSEVAVALAEGVVAPNADTARNLGFLRATDLTEYLPERLLTTAKNMVQTASPVPLAPFSSVDVVLVGMIDRGLATRRQRGALTDYDVTIGQRIRQIVARTADYAECVERERKESIDLGGKALGQARLRHIIETGKVLRN